jgi:hypothetical protein
MPITSSLTIGKKLNLTYQSLEVLVLKAQLSSRYCIERRLRNGWPPQSDFWMDRRPGAKNIDRKNQLLTLEVKMIQQESWGDASQDSQ